MNHGLLAALSDLMDRPALAAQDSTAAHPVGIAPQVMQVAAEMLANETATTDDIRAVAVLLHCTLGDALQVIGGMQRPVSAVSPETPIGHPV
ncbi:hypothetical protein ABZ370_19610 [Streptomyces sp. NPDC005962]|uniref:hypothetical protein n=1 Tax=Streptomyces sp. NPDC005962 TaxID=3154466 RepID=UPI0033FE5159